MDPLRIKSSLVKSLPISGAIFGVAIVIKRTQMAIETFSAPSVDIKTLRVIAIGIETLGIKAIDIKTLSVKPVDVVTIDIKAIDIKAIDIKALPVTSAIFGIAIDIKWCICSEPI